MQITLSSALQNTNKKLVQINDIKEHPPTKKCIKACKNFGYLRIMPGTSRDKQGHAGTRQGRAGTRQGQTGT